MKKTEELIPLHEEDIHFNIIVHKSHNTYSNLSRTQEHIKFQHKENTTIFGDDIHPKAPFLWAQVTNINRPAHQETQQVPAPKVNLLQYRSKKDNSPSRDELPREISFTSNSNDSRWNIVGKGGKASKQYNIPIHNRFESLPNSDDIEDISKLPNFSCGNCDLKFSSQSVMRTHMKIHKDPNTSTCKCFLSKENQKVIDEVKFLRSELEKSKNEIKTLRESKSLKQNEHDNIIQPQTIRPKEVTRDSVITFRCQNCPFTTKNINNLNHHTKNNHEANSHSHMKCEICNISFNSEGSLKQHMLNEHKERLAQLNCNTCSFQASTRTEFLNHIPIHGVGDQTINLQIIQWKCRNCEEIFENKVTLMNHRRDNHEMPMCYFDMEDRCSQSSERCWYTHKSAQKTNTTNQKIIICFTCKQEFNYIGGMMEHRKEIHPETVKLCTKFSTGECRRVKCWFLHTNQLDFPLLRETQKNP